MESSDIVIRYPVCLRHELQHGAAGENRMSSNAAEWLPELCLDALSRLPPFDGPADPVRCAPVAGFELTRCRLRLTGRGSSEKRTLRKFLLCTNGLQQYVYKTG